MTSSHCLSLVKSLIYVRLTRWTSSSEVHYPQ